MGVSMFVPSDIYDDDTYERYPLNTQFQTTAWYTAANWKATGW